MEYQLEIKQVVDYPRIRIYRDFIRELMRDSSIRTTKSSYLFFYVVLNSFANFRTSYKRIDGKCFTVYPGEWVCTVKELTGWFRMRFQHQALAVMEYLQNQNYIKYTLLCNEKVIKFRIPGFRRANTILDYNAPCQKDTGFFFLPISTASELISIGNCSEMDILLDLWINAIYNDKKVQGSGAAPVVYIRNCTGNPLVSYSDLAVRWNVSKTTVSRVLGKLKRLDYIDMISSNTKQGTIIYLHNYLSTMFDISDVMVDKEEVAMDVGLKYNCPDISADCANCVSQNGICVPKPHIEKMVKKVAELLQTQGIPCIACPKSAYILSPLSDCQGKFDFQLSIQCPRANGPNYRFDVSVLPQNQGKGGSGDGK